MRLSRPLKTAALLSCLLVIVSVPARGAIEGSPHDLIAQGYDVIKVSLQHERCSRCHISSSPALQPLIPEVPPILANSHSAASLGCFSCHDGTTIVSPDVDASRTAFHPSSHGLDLTGYEGLSSEAVGLPHLSGKRMECVTCHDPHDNNHRPFLRADLRELCLFCHAKNLEYGRGKENRSGNHLLAPDPLALPRPEAPLKIDAAFRTEFPSPYPLGGGKGNGGWHWESGGHLSLGRTGGVSCATCHAVHGNHSDPPGEKLLALAPVNEVANLFCEGCHAGTRGDGRTAPPYPNPGGTTTARTYHAVDDDESNGTGRVLEIREPPGWPFGGGTPRRLLCTTCHAAHFALAQTSLLRTPAKAPGFCEECHEQVSVFHHPAGVVSETRCGKLMPAPTYGTARLLGCADCHRAHNAGLGQARANDYVPQLLASARSGALCTRCHPPANPTCSERIDYQASHFIGDPTLFDTYNDKAPPLRIEIWPESGLTSVYGGDKDQAVTCLSCHVFRAGAVVSGDGGTARYLFARSGNRQEWLPDGEAHYLCTGCHGARPATAEAEKGHTHPLMVADMKRTGQEPAPPVTATPTGKINCDSCHRPHEARTSGGRYILEAVNGENADPLAIRPQIDFTVLCLGCHKKY